MIAMYDLEDNYIMSFDNYKECATYFKTSVNVIQDYICRHRKGEVDKKRDLDGNWIRLFKIEEDENE